MQPESKESSMRGRPEVDLEISLDSNMADGSDRPMSPAEEVLVWLLVEKIGVPDDVPYSPNQAQEIISRHLDRAKELDQIADMLAEGQGDDDGSAILPEFEKGSSVYARVEACLHLLERRRDALAAPASAEPVALIEKHRRDLAFLLSVIDGISEATGEAPSEEDAAILAELRDEASAPFEAVTS